MTGRTGLLLVAAGLCVLLSIGLSRTLRRRSPLALATAAGVLACLLVLVLPFSLAVLVYRDFGTGLDRFSLLILAFVPPVLAPALALASLRLLHDWRGRAAVLGGLLLAGLYAWLTLTGVAPHFPS